MTDISKCTNKECESKNKCWRYTAPANPYWQSYIEKKGKMEKCDMFLEVKRVKNKN